MDFKFKSLRLKCFLLLLLFSGLAGAQNNLAFSRVLLLTATDTVPAGRVWKVESVLQGTSSAWQTVTSGTNSYFSVCGFLVNGVYTSAINYYRWYSTTTTGNGTAQSATSAGFQGTSLPLWLPAGTAIAPATNANGVSVIEYYITP